AMLWLLRNAGFNTGNPYNSSRTQIGFGTFGSPHISALMTEVSEYALRAQWFQKWWVHRALRPEAYGGLVHNMKAGTAQYPFHAVRGGRGHQYPSGSETLLQRIFRRLLIYKIRRDWNHCLGKRFQRRIFSGCGLKGK